MNSSARRSSAGKSGEGGSGRLVLAAAAPTKAAYFRHYDAVTA
jgi:hypothetical protein